MAIGTAWWEAMRECQGMLTRGDVVASRARLRTLFQCIKAAAEPAVLTLLEPDDREELHRLARAFREVWHDAQRQWVLRN